MPLQRFIIERDIPKVGSFDSRQLKEAAIKSNEVLKQLGNPAWGQFRSGTRRGAVEQSRPDPVMKVTPARGGCNDTEPN